MIYYFHHIKWKQYSDNWNVFMHDVYNSWGSMYEDSK